MIDKSAAFITEISEEDFRKLKLKGYRTRKEFVDGPHPGAKSKEGSWVYLYEEVDLNEELDENIAYWMDKGYQSDFEDLKYPVTVAIHTENGPEPKDFYFDKFMNRYSGPKTYEMAMGLRHIYSTRDYFESKEDYWRVLKRETKAIYRVHLDIKYLENFKLKHKTETFYIFNDQKADFVHRIEKNYDLDEKTGEWNVSSLVEVRICDDSSSYVPISEEQAKLLIENDPKPEICYEPNTEKA